MLRLLFICCFLISARMGGAAGLSTHDVAFFEKKVRPILVEHCYACHSADAKKVKGNLLLDTRAGWELGGDLGPAIVPGDPDQSLLIQAVRYDDPDLEMPPKGTLANAEIETLIEWVERGAPDPRVGGMEALASRTSGIDYEVFRKQFPYTQAVAHPVPEPTNPRWARNEVDRFLLARLEAESLRPNPDTDPATLLRRLTYDLTGLPPTREALRAFSANPSDEAFARQVDALLDAPQFGERWGRHWLDVARYADSSGGGRSKVFHEAWRYRDWVIDAFNHDMPYDQFVREQIAGDLLEASDLGMIGTGFLLMAPTNFENQDKKALELDVVDEQIDVIGRAFMGMTIGCARCHDHKFDAISHEDYHALAGIFMSTKSLKHSNVSDPWKREMPVSNERRARLERYRDQLDGINQNVRNLRGKIAALEKDPSTSSREPRGKLTGIVLDDTEAETVGFWKPSTSIKGYIGAGYIHDGNEDKGAKSVSYFPNVPVAGRYEVRVSHTPSVNRGTSVPVEVNHADGRNVVTVNQRRPGPIDRAWTSLGTFRFAQGNEGSVVYRNGGTDAVVIADAVQFIPQTKARGREPKQAPSTPGAAEAEARGLERARLQEALQAAEAEKKALERNKPPPLPHAMAVEDADKPEDMQRRIRGVAHKLGERIPRGFPRVAAEPGTAIDGSGRRQLAQWLTREDNPFLARVMVNRLWRHVFGEGLVRTPDNFGAMGETPSHPELLDWLALRFIADGWSVKKHLRLLLQTRAYRMSSEMHVGHYYADAENRLLWRAHRKALEAEALRDTMLMISGQLDLTVGGRVFDRKLGNVQAFAHGKNQRRSVYQPVFRNNLPQIFEVFDFADSNQPVGRRPVSVLPTQALYMMNAPEVMHLAETTAEQMDGLDLRDWFPTILGRPPLPSEEQAARAFLAENPDGASQLIQTLFASFDFRTLK